MAEKDISTVCIRDVTIVVPYVALRRLSFATFVFLLGAFVNPYAFSVIDRLCRMDVEWLSNGGSSYLLRFLCSGPIALSYSAVYSLIYCVYSMTLLPNYRRASPNVLDGALHGICSFVNAPIWYARTCRTATTMLAQTLSFYSTSLSPRRTTR